LLSTHHGQAINTFIVYWNNLNIIHFWSSWWQTCLCLVMDKTVKREWRELKSEKSRRWEITNTTFKKTFYFWLINSMTLILARINVIKSIGFFFRSSVKYVCWYSNRWITSPPADWRSAEIRNTLFQLLTNRLNLETHGTYMKIKNTTVLWTNWI